MIITYDTEFWDTGRETYLISIGLVDETGDTLYLINSNAPWSGISQQPWLVENVLSKLPGGWSDHNVWLPDYKDPAVVPYETISARVEEFLVRRGGPWDVELWADYPATDHVLLYQLFGPMVECTKHGMPMRTSCLTQEEESVKRSIRRHLGAGPTVQGDAVTRLSVSVIGDWTYRRPLQEPATEHHALHDARHDMDLARWLGLTDS